MERCLLFLKGIVVSTVFYSSLGLAYDWANYGNGTSAPATTTTTPAAGASGGSGGGCPEELSSKAKCVGFNLLAALGMGGGGDCDDKVARAKCELQRSGVQTVTAPAVVSAYNSCSTISSGARNACLEWMSPEFQGLAVYLGGTTSVIGALTGLGAACKKQSEILDVANKAFGAYNLACTGMKFACQQTCGGLAKAAVARGKQCEGIISACQSAGVMTCASNVEYQNCLKEVPILPNIEKASGVVVAACSGYAKNLMAGAAAAGVMVLEAKKAKKCEKENQIADCSANPDAPGCRLNCTDPANAQKQQCICLRTPGAVGCDSVAGTLNSDSSYNSTTSGGLLDKDKSLAPPAVPNGQSPFNMAQDGKASGAGGSPMGGGGPGVSGGGGAGGGAAKSVDAKASKALNTGIIAGDYGGGGGGGRGGGGGPDPLQKYRSAMPDAARNPANDFKLQVSGGGGKSNWEKVNERYRDLGFGLVGP